MLECKQSPAMRIPGAPRPAQPSSPSVAPVPVAPSAPASIAIPSALSLAASPFPAAPPPAATPDFSPAGLPSSTSGRSDVPLVIFHLGNPPFLQICLEQARRNNPDARIVLLGDDSNRGLGFAEHAHIAEYARYAAEFKSVYTH